MSDQDFLIWIHERLTDVHSERATFDYMHKLRSIILATESNKVTPNKASYNNIDELRQEFNR